MHVHRWDLDRTYLDTDIHSVRGLIRTALETAGEKRNIPGSAALMRGLRAADPGARIHVLSGSPTQLRRVLEEKLQLDGVQVDRMVLKDNLGNLRRGRLRAVRGQVGYKLPALLGERAELPVGARETLFGDDTETDALIYAAYAEAVAGRLSPSAVQRLLVAADAYPDHVAAALAALARVPTAEAVEDIFIHLDQRSPLWRFEGLPKVIPVFSWFQAAAVLWVRGRLRAESVAEVAAEAGGGAPRWVNALLDLVRRGVISADRVAALVAEPPLAPIRDGVRRGLDRLVVVAPSAGATVDLVAALARFRSAESDRGGGNSRDPLGS
jgi:hypothetical protein